MGHGQPDVAQQLHAGRPQDGGVSRCGRGGQVVQRRHRVGAGRHEVVRGGDCICRSTAGTRTAAGASTASSCARSSPFRKRHDRTFFYGANFEFSFNAPALGLDALHIRDSTDYRLAPQAIDIIVNPIVDTRVRRAQDLEFVRPRASPTTSRQGGRVAAEEYDDFGPVHDSSPERRAGASALRRRRPHLEDVGHRGGRRRRADQRVGQAHVQADPLPRSQEESRKVVALRCVLWSPSCPLCFRPVRSR